MLISDAMTSADNAKTESYTRGPAFQAPTSFEVRVVKGIDAGAKIHVDRSDPSRQLVGTSPACSFRLSDKRVSRRHAAFEPVGDHLQLTDLKSTNGTFVNGQRVADQLLAPGDVVRVG